MSFNCYPHSYGPKNTLFPQTSWCFFTFIPFIISSRTATYHNNYNKVNKYLPANCFIEKNIIQRQRPHGNSTCISPCLRLGFNRLWSCEALDRDLSRSSCECLWITIIVNKVPNPKWRVQVILASNLPEENGTISLVFTSQNQAFWLQYIASADKMTRKLRN